MNCLAYPIIFDAMKSNNFNNISIFLYDFSMVHIFRKDEFIILKDSDGTIYSDKSTFNFVTTKPIDKIIINCDKYGPMFTEIFDRTYWRASVAVQRAWKRYKKLI